MITVRQIGRSAVDRWLRAVRLPLAAAARLVPGDEGRANAALLAIDGTDANIREAIGGFFRDHELSADAERRRIAVDERRRALELRQSADIEERAAEQRLQRELDSAQRVRALAEADAQRLLQQTEANQAEREQSAHAAAEAKRQAAERARENKLAAAELKAKRERLATLDEQATVLDQEATALTATDEAERLRNAAGAAKAARKRPTPANG